MYKIKEFSEITNIPVATLRYYDEIDLLYPSSTDINTGYRYYEDKQLYKANLIVELKKLGLSLDEIKEYLKTNDNKLLERSLDKYEEKIRLLKEFMEKQQEKTYKIVKSDINKWKELNGSLNQNCALALEIKANNANYYYIEENGKIVADFAIYKEIKWITTRNRIIQNKELFDIILEELKSDFDEIMTIQPVENEEIINYLLNTYETTQTEAYQGPYKYLKIRIKL